MQQNNNVQITVQWRSKTQKTMPLSTAEAEYYAAPEMAMAVILTDLPPQPPRHQEAQEWDTPLYEDNTASLPFVIYDNEANLCVKGCTTCIEWTSHVIGPGGRERGKHIDIRNHLARTERTRTVTCVRSRSRPLVSWRKFSPRPYHHGRSSS
jgi:hypothetical protein